LLYLGCPIWGYKGWVGNFFPLSTPQSNFLRLYSRRLTTVEGNTTFYATPTVDVIAHWRDETPTGFHFCPKISRSISHNPHIEAAKSETLFFTERMRGLGDRLGPMFLQLPPAFGPKHFKQLQAFLDFWPTDLRLAVEVRHPDFYQEPHATILNTLLSQHKVARVMMDTRPIRIGSAEEKQVLQARERKPDLPVEIAITTDFTFLRYIGHPRMEVNETFLDAWAKHLAEWLGQGITPYVFCHCPFQEFSPSICYALYERVRRLIPLSALPWKPAESDGEPEQGRLF
jgi:uncharacterized protein YecE (DUF72 family)